ncbi:DNA-3-methyladenine glycosylase II protein [Dioscorea alata]|uniref:DNA-3-methyladenine glycosylase II protein n=2 Tax=Dioscorea alata TaxID=55571 RepID=A0ACB7TTG9_DIOAL|nr:DNA-3-methyladenine glycosylase II protein [Dioscorea alata]KAH7651096.1 DNA-3-methyladenine glycosylase II protein [Dioscorea alata]
MTQLLWPPPPSSSTSLSSSMGEQTLSQTHTSPSSSPSPSTAPPIVSPSDPPSSSSSAASKIPFRPRKIRKVSSDGDASNKPPPPPAKLPIRYLPRPLSADGEVASALRHLRAVDPHLARIIETHEPPVFNTPHPPFHSLARSILYQQLAFKAAASIYSRFISLCGGEDSVVPEAVLALSPHQLRQIGVSARKASYLHDLARKYHTGILSDASIVSMDDKSLFSMLTMVKGIGAWSVHMFMIFSLHRPDVLPVGDLGVRKGVQMLYGLEDVPRPSQMDNFCERWKPYRSVGAWYMWRLVESKGSSAAVTASNGAGTQAITSGGMGAGALQQAQLIDPIQMLPNLG